MSARWALAITLITLPISSQAWAQDLTGMGRVGLSTTLLRPETASTEIRTAIANPNAFRTGQPTITEVTTINASDVRVGLGSEGLGITTPAGPNPAAATPEAATPSEPAIEEPASTGSTTGPAPEGEVEPVAPLGTDAGAGAPPAD